MGRSWSQLALRHAARASGVRLDVDLLQLALGPLHGLLGRHALDGLGVHVGDDVLGQHLGGLGVRRAGVAGRLAEPAGDLVTASSPDPRPTSCASPTRPSAAWRSPSARRTTSRSSPGVWIQLQELLRRLLVLRVARQHVRLEGVHAELARRALGQRRVQDVGLELRALLGLVLVGLAQRLDVDRGAVQRRRDGLRQEGAVVVGVVPGEAALVVRVLPERRS